MVLGVRGAAVSEEVDRGFSFPPWCGGLHSLDGRDCCEGTIECFIKTCPPGKPWQQQENKDENEDSAGLQKIKHCGEYYRTEDKLQSCIG